MLTIKDLVTYKHLLEYHETGISIKNGVDTKYDSHGFPIEMGATEPYLHATFKFDLDDKVCFEDIFEKKMEICGIELERIVYHLSDEFMIGNAEYISKSIRGTKVTYEDFDKEVALLFKPEEIKI